MTYIKNARQLLTVATGFEPRPADAAVLLADTLAHALQRAKLPVEDAIARLRHSFETLEAAEMQSSRRADAAPITMTYRNYRGEVDQRTVFPTRIWWGSTDWHPEPGWLMSAYDLAKAAHRDFALADCQFADLAAPPLSAAPTDDTTAGLVAELREMANLHEDMLGDRAADHMEYLQALAPSAAPTDNTALVEALTRAERKLKAYVGICNGDKELTETVLPMARAALASRPPPKADCPNCLGDGYDVPSDGPCHCPAPKAEGDVGAWQDISTAPKDGTRFLAFHGDVHFDCWWHVDEETGDGWWVDHADNEPWPSHWMPLPEAPRPQSSPQGGER